MAELFWRDAKDPRDVLSTSIRRLNAGGEVVRNVGRHRLCAIVSCDAVEFERAAKLVDPRSLLDLYTGAFLDGLDLELGEEIEEWLYAKREHLADLCRQAELDAILGALATEHMRLLTLHGPGGAGKSRLSLEAARLAAGSGLSADGVYFVPLETVTDAEAVPGAIASSLHVILAPDRPPSDQLIQVIGARSMLLVLDNAEHLVDSAPFLASLLRQCPNVRLLVTSRVRLGLAEEHVMNIYGLDLGLDRAEKSDAIDLLHERMKQHGSLSQLTYDVTGAEFEVCQLLHGAPLAIELAAALTRAMLRGSGTPSSTSTRPSRSDTTCWALRR